jgi:L-asparagine transporter-like permease
VAKQTSISPVVYSDMLQGSISSSASQAFGDLAGYVVGKAVGAP